MNLRKPKLATLLLLGGGTLVVIALALFSPRFVPFLETALSSDTIPTAPLLGEFVPTTSEALLPLGDADQTPTAEVLATGVNPMGAIAGAEELPSATPTLESPQIQPTDTPTLQPTLFVPATLAPRGVLPVSMRIPDIVLDAPVVPIGWTLKTVDGQNQAVWDVPNWRAAGWHNTSSRLGAAGNTVFNGHNTSNGEVFRDLYKLEPGASVYVDGEDGKTYTYEVLEVYILKEAGQPLSVRLENARYIQQTPDERLTLVTCHPYGSLANRLVVIAYPVQEPVIEERIE